VEQNFADLCSFKSFHDLDMKEKATDAASVKKIKKKLEQSSLN